VGNRRGTDEPCVVVVAANPSAAREPIARADAWPILVHGKCSVFQPIGEQRRLEPEQEGLFGKGCCPAATSEAAGAESLLRAGCAGIGTLALLGLFGLFGLLRRLAVITSGALA